MYCSNRNWTSIVTVKVKVIKVGHCELIFFGLFISTYFGYFIFRWRLGIFILIF